MESQYDPNIYTGQLYLDIVSENELDFETASAIITVIEIADPNGLYARGTVEVDIVDVNEAPLFDERIMKSFFVIEESAVGTAVGLPLSVMTSDPEAGDIFYSFDCLSNESYCMSRESPDSEWNHFFIENNYFLYSDRNVSIFSIEFSSGQISVETQDASTLKGHQEYKLVVRLTDAKGLSCRSVDPPVLQTV